MFGRMYRSIAHRADELLVAAIVLVGAALYYAPSLMNLMSNNGFAPTGAESTQVASDLQATFGKDEANVLVIMKSDGQTAGQPAFKQAAEDVVHQLKAKKEVSAVHTVYDTGQQSLVSTDKHSALALVTVSGNRKQQESVAASLRDTVKSQQLHLSYAGALLLDHDITAQINKDLSLAETVSFALLAVLLVIVFRGVVAALLPLLLGGFTVLVALLVLRGMVEFTTIVEYALNVIILIGLGLAVDYSLLMVSRFREELVNQKGDVTEALRVSMQTAGRTIFFSGLTVIISLLSLVVFPLDFLRSMGLGGAAAVLVAMGGALIVLPSMLRLLGTRVNWLSFGHAKRLDQALKTGKKHEEKQSFWRKTGQVFMRMPLLTIVVTLALLLLAGAPFLRAKFATPDASVLPPSNIARQATEQLNRDFAFSDSPIKVLYTTSKPNLSNAQAQRNLGAYITELKKLPGVQNAELGAVPQGQKAVVHVSYKGEPTSGEAQDIVRRVRSLSPGADARVQVGGATAELVDLLDVLKKYIPVALAIIGVTLFVLLFLMLGSLVIPLVAIVQNTLSLCASFGALVWIFQEGHFADWLHMNVVGSIDATQPVLIFAVAFGLSMDYSVFLYGRIKEEYDKTHDTKSAVLNGLQKTGGIITSAAVLLFVVVAAFATSRISIMQQIGVGLALAILVDAFLVRMVLVPATMKLLGRLNWWAPSALKRLHARIGFTE